MARRQRASSAVGRDIAASMPKVKNSARKRKARRSLRRFLDTYLGNTFTLPWSSDHLKVIKCIEQAVLRGGLFAMAMPRGSGKTSIIEGACLWVILYGHRHFVCPIGASEAAAHEILASIKTELEVNELLYEDFPRAIHPIRELEGIANRCKGQLYKGKRTQITWTLSEIVMPTMTKSAAAGIIIRVAGLTGRIRGMKFKRPDGQTVRPDLFIADDPQTDDSARSASQCVTREKLLAGAVLGLAGPTTKISGIMPCTVIRPGDLADTILDRQKHPEWRGTRTKMMYSFPTDDALWLKYADIRADSLRAHDDIRLATAFYKAHRKAMDAGAMVAWKERFNHDELSAIQHAMNLKFQDEAAFQAEYQNDPLPEIEEGTQEMLSADEIAAKTNGLPQGRIPIGADHLTAFIDVQGGLLYWLVAAWESNFTGTIIAYGSYPDQHRRYFTVRDAQHTLHKDFPNASLEGRVYGGLKIFTEDLLSREWKRDDGANLRIERCLIDANWGKTTDVIYQFCRQSAHAAVILPSHGYYVGASSLPFSEYKRKRGDRVGFNWRIPSTHGKRAIRHIIYDTNYWKSFVHSRFAVAMGDPGCLALWGRSADAHRLIADHLTAEFAVKTEGRGRTVDEWKMRPGKSENHWLDCAVGAAVAASIQGAGLAEMQKARPLRARKRITQADLNRRRRTQRA